jgi:hypothetical protein
MMTDKKQFELKINPDKGRYVIITTAVNQRVTKVVTECIDGKPRDLIYVEAIEVIKNDD